MFDAAFLERCADPGVKIEIVQRFIAAVATENPLAISITSGNRVILPEPPKTPEEAVSLAQRFAGEAVVRGGVTQFPVGISETSEINVDLFDPCKNIRMGTALFGKIYRIVAHAQEAEDGTTLHDALAVWRTGLLGGEYVFADPDPGPQSAGLDSKENAIPDAVSKPVQIGASADASEMAEDPNTAGIRVPLPVSIGP